MAMPDRLVLPRVIGHRGAMAYAPENTGAAIREAKARGAEWVEFDLRLARDGTVVVIHDAKLERTTTGHGRVGAHDWRYLSALDAGRWFDQKFAGERLLRLEDMIALLAELGLGANLEIKTSGRRTRALARAAAACLSEHWPRRLPPPLVSSFDRRALAALHAMDAPWPRGILFKALPRNWRRLAARFGCVSVHCAADKLTDVQAAAVKAAGYTLAAYTVNDPAAARRLAGWGVDAVFSNVPDVILKAL
jgi:glycerophosphoryl diester phosphodiesterase